VSRAPLTDRPGSRAEQSWIQQVCCTLQGEEGEEQQETYNRQSKELDDYLIFFKLSKHAFESVD